MKSLIFIMMVLVASINIHAQTDSLMVSDSAATVELINQRINYHEQAQNKRIKEWAVQDPICNQHAGAIRELYALKEKYSQKIKREVKREIDN